MPRYSKELRSRLVQKLTAPNAPSALYLSKEINMSAATLSRWVKQFRDSGGCNMEKQNRRPEDVSAQERFQVLLKVKTLKGEKLGAYLRTQGLTTSHIHQWHKEFIDGVSPNKDAVEMRSLKKKNMSLEKEVLRKDKALAETSALLILKKKANLIWGEDVE